MKARSIGINMILGKKYKHINIPEESKINEEITKWEIHKQEEIILLALEYK